MTEMKFICTSCGACCRRAGKAGLLPDRGDGACIFLTEDNKCKIYEDRPEICRVEKMSDRYKKLFNLTTKEVYKLNNSICNKWIKEDNMDESYLIDVGQYGTDSEKS